MERAVTDLSGCDRLVAMLSSFLPTDQERQEILRVWIAFLGYAVGRADLMAEHRQSAGELRQMIIQELVTLQSQGDIRPDVDPEQEANVLLALVNGVSLDTLIQAKSLSREQQETVLQRYVDGLCPKQIV